MRHNNSCWKSGIPRSNQISDEDTKALIKLLMPTTPLRDLPEGMPDYWDVDPPNTESSKKNTHAGGEEDWPAGEAKVEVFSKRSAWGTAPQ
jgi:hypothetical protein